MCCLRKILLILRGRMNKEGLSRLPAFPHREFTEEEAERLVQMAKEAEEKARHD